MDYYLNNENVYNRLLNEYFKHNQLIVAYDFDNTVYDYHKVGHSHEQTIKLLQRLKRLNCYLIIFTANDDIPFIKKYCFENQIPFDTINENAPFIKSNGRKIYYNILLDDRAGLNQTHALLTKFVNQINQNL